MSTKLPALVFAATVAMAGMAPVAAQPPQVTCEACVVVDGAGRVLWARHAEARLPNASTTKMVTALVVVAQEDLREIVTISAAAAATPAGGFDLEAGERYSVEDLLYAMLLTSSNDAAVALAEHTSGSEAVFVDQMNRLARELGADDSHFETPHGLDRPGHVSTPQDLVRIGREVLAQPTLATIVATPTVTIPAEGGEALENTNPLLERYRGAVGIKTGMTALAGDVLVAAARRGGLLVMSAAMRSENAARDSRRLLSFGFKRLTAALVAESVAIVVRSVTRMPYSVAPVLSAR